LIESRQSYCSENRVQFFGPTRYTGTPTLLVYSFRADLHASWNLFY